MRAMPTAPPSSRMVSLRAEATPCPSAGNEPVIAVVPGVMLVVDVLKSCVPELHAPEAADFEGALYELVRQMQAVVQEEHWRRFLPSLMLLSQEAERYADVDRRMKESQLEVIDEVLRRGIAEGVLPPSVLDDIEATTSLLVGPILMAGLTDGDYLDDVSARQCAVQFVAGQARALSHR
jgi:hypothetical protein